MLYYQLYCNKVCCSYHVKQAATILAESLLPSDWLLDTKLRFGFGLWFRAVSSRKFWLLIILAANSKEEILTFCKN